MWSDFTKTRQFWPWSTIVFLSVLTIIGITGAFTESPAKAKYFDDLHWTSSYLCTCVLLVLAYRKTIDSPIAVFFRWTIIGAVVETIGQIIWDVQDIYDYFPFPGPSDLFLMMMGPTLAVGVWKYGKTTIETNNWKTVRLDSLTMLIAIVTSSLALFLPIRGEFTPLQLFVMLAYPVGFAAPFCLLMVIMLVNRIQLNLWSILMPLSILIFGYVWTQWNLNFIENKLISGSILNISFSVSSILIGVTALFFAPIKNASKNWDHFCEGVLRSIPLVMVVLSSAGFVLASAIKEISNSLLILVSIGGGLVIILAALRQYILLGERDRLVRAESMVTQKEAELQQSNHELESLNKTLEERIDQRTKQLAQSEKLASLGTLVAGVAHELNTPLGNSLLMTSTLIDRCHDMLDLIENGKLGRTKIQTEVTMFMDGCELIKHNLERQILLVTNFKQIAVDRHGGVRREFFLHNVVNDTLTMRRILLKKTNISIVDAIPNDLCMEGYPGALCQLLDILLENAVLHAFEKLSTGVIRVQAAQFGSDQVQIVVEDNGAGIPDSNLSKIFDPFFTTHLGTGGSGLGLHIGWNIISNVLGGCISVSSATDVGTKFLITIPMLAPASKNNENI